MIFSRVGLGILQSQWPKEFEVTSSHRFRSGEDMQYAFSYFYFLMHAPRGRKPKHLLRELDADGDGFFSDNELYTLVGTLITIMLIMYLILRQSPGNRGYDGG